MAGPNVMMSEDVRHELVRNLAPEIEDLTTDYYSPDHMHPFMNNMFTGGVLLRANVEFGTETMLVSTATGFQPTEAIYRAEDWVNNGLPEDLDPESVVWSVITSRMIFAQNIENTARDPYPQIINNSVNYWDGENWHTTRQRARVNGHSNAEWISSELLDIEKFALKALTVQTRGLHSIAEAYGNNSLQFERDLIEDPTVRKLVLIGLAPALSMHDEDIIDIDGVGRSGFMNFYSTGYQITGKIIDDILSRARIREADSNGNTGNVPAALRSMFKGAASLSKDALIERAAELAAAHEPLPLPAEW